MNHDEVLSLIDAIYGEAADPWLTAVGYFNSLRELGGMRRLAEDDVRTRVLGQQACDRLSDEAPVVEAHDDAGDAAHSSPRTRRT